MAALLSTVRQVLNRRYGHLLSTTTGEATVEPAHDALCAMLFCPQQSADTTTDGLDEVDRYLSLGGVTSRTLVDAMKWWQERKSDFPAHYQMAADYLATPATSTASERANSVAGREFTAARQSLSSTVFIQTMCLRSWMNAELFPLPENREDAVRAAQAASTSAQQAYVVTNLVDEIDLDQQTWQDEILDDVGVQILNLQFEEVEEQLL